MPVEPVRPGNLPRRILTRAAVALVLGFIIAPATLARAQSGPALIQATSTQPVFDAVSVKPYAPNARAHAQIDPQRLELEGWNLRTMIENAYGLHKNQISGLPGWATTEPFSVIGTTNAPATQKRMLILLRGVLVDRFHLKFTDTSVVRPVDALVIAPGGLKMKPITAADGCSPTHLMALAHKEVPSDAVGGAFGCSTSDLVQRLNAIPQDTPDGLPVIDRTGLTGRYPIVVWQRTLGFRKVGSSYKWDSLEPFNDALKRELGLEVIKTTAPYRVMHVTRIERPTPN